MAEAKVSKETAQQTALAKAPGGTVKECEIEKEKGKLIWSFDITTPDTKDITEVNVDAITATWFPSRRKRRKTKRKRPLRTKVNLQRQPRFKAGRCGRVAQMERSAGVPPAAARIAE